MFNQIVLMLLIGMTSIIGDKLVEHGQSQTLHAVADNFTHGLVAGLSWTLIVILSKESIVINTVNIVTCAVLSSIIDLDHFIQANSWKLTDAIRLDKRPFLHCTTVPIILWLLLLTTSKLIITSTKLEIASWLILTSFLSHHIRDATRRGLWFAPIGSTQPIPYYCYIIVDMLLPHIVFYFMTQCTNNNIRHATYRGLPSIV